MVTLHYAVFDDEGEPVEDEAQELTALFGRGQLLPALERGLEGHRAGQQVQVEVPCAEAFGPRDPSAVLEIDRDEFPAEVEPGDRFEAEREDGNVLVLQVLEVGEEHVLLDTNHPLAGQNLLFEIQILAVRPATTAEIDEATALLLSGHEPLGSGLLPASGLLRGRSER